MWSGWTLNFSQDYDELRTTKTVFFMVKSTEPQMLKFGRCRYDIKETFKDLSKFQDARRFLRNCRNCKYIASFSEFRVTSLMSAALQFSLKCSWPVCITNTHRV